jgi:hypothetical protein
MKQSTTVTRPTKPQFKVTRIIKGFEFGHGQISGLATNNEVLELVGTMIHDNPGILVPIDRDHDGRVLTDDGCGDGRAVLTVFSLDHTYKRSLNRSKVFGGSATMATACLIGLGEAGKHSLNQVFTRSINTLNKRGMDFGAHTDEHMHGNNCGCGAIDKAPQILFASLKYEIPIRGVITMLSNYVSGLNDVYANFRTYVQHLASQPDYSGMEVMDQIINSSHIVKQLGGDHRECRIVLNTIRGYTVNQKLVRDATQNEAQIFAVDVWRMEDIAHKLYPDQLDLQHQAFISELIYTVATAAVLTKGDLPVDVITQKA